MKKTIITIVCVLVIIMVGLTCAVLILNNIKEDKSSLEIKQEKVINYLKENAGIQVFFKTDTAMEDIEKYKEEVSKIDGVTKVEFISKEDGYNEMKKRFAGREDILEGYGTEVFPDSILVVISDTTKNESVEDQIKEISTQMGDLIDEMSNSYYYLEKEINEVKNLSEEELNRFIELRSIVIE